VWSSQTYAALPYGYGTANVMSGLYTVDSSFVVTPSDDSGLAVRDTRTGRLMDEIQPDPGWSFVAQQVVGDQLYAFLGEEHPGSAGRINDYDLRTGLVRWHVDLTGTEQVPQGYDPVIATPRDVIAQLPDGVAYGFLASNGRQSWTYRLPADCDVYNEADGLGTGSASGTANASGTVAYLLRCDNGDERLISLDTATGTIAWQQTISTGIPLFTPPLGTPTADLGPLLVTHNGDIIVQAGPAHAGHPGDTLMIFRGNGRLIFSRTVQLTCAESATCPIGDGGSTVTLTLSGGVWDSPPKLENIDLITGAIRWQQPGDNIDLESTIAEDSTGILYADDAALNNPPLLPESILAVQASTGHTVVLPLPVGEMRYQATGPDLASVIGVADGLLIAQSRGPDDDFLITGYRPEGAPTASTALGGSSVADWPDACTLLAPADLRFLAPGYVPVPQHLTLGGISWLKPVTCSYAIPGKKEPVVTLTIGWVAATTAQAAQIYASALNECSFENDAAIPVTGWGDGTPTGAEAYLVPDTSGRQRDSVLIRSGRVILTVNVPNDGPAAERLVPAVLARLR
jgi:outer membrane protein assembly factor BamB